MSKSPSQTQTMPLMRICNCNNNRPNCPNCRPQSRRKRKITSANLNSESSNTIATSCQQQQQLGVFRRIAAATTTTMMMMIAASLVMKRQPFRIQQVHGLSTTRLFSKATSPFRNGSSACALQFQRRSITSDNSENNPRDIGFGHGRRSRHGHPLATAFVSQPEIGDDENDTGDSGEWQQQDDDQGSSNSLLLEGLNPSQVEAVTQPLWDEGSYSSSSRNGPSSSVITRVIAGPGSGKTKVLTTRIAHLLQEDPYGKILAVTFTRKAAGEMKERLDRLLREQEQALTEGDDDQHHDDNSLEDDAGEAVVFQENSQNPGEADAEGSTNPNGIERVELGTFHSICAKILRFNGELLRDLPSVRRDMSMATDADEINLNGQYAIVDQTEQIRTLNECLKEQEIDLKKTELKPIQIITSIGKMKEMFAQGQDPFTDQRKQNGRPGGAGAALRTARRIYYPYREKLLSNNAVDFDDLILMSREMLSENEDLRERLHRRWPHVLVDEYQDTSKIQMDLIKLLTSSSLFVVGDADQSIYSWRGAHVGSLEDVATDFSDYGIVKTVFLKENYRSTSNIVKAAEKVISSGQAPSVLGQALADAGVDEEERNRIEGDSKTDVQSKTDDLRRAMKPKRGSGPSPRVVACEDERAEAKFVVDTIMNMTAHGDLQQSDTVAMIYRTNAQSRYLEEACVKQNLPYVIRGGAGGFYKRAEIRDCLCFLKWINNGNDDGSMMRCMKTPTKGIGEKAFTEFKAYCELIQKYFRQNCPDQGRPTCLDVLISMTDDMRGGDNTDSEGDSETTTEYFLPEGAPLPQDHIAKRALTPLLKFSSKMSLIRSRAYTENIGKLLLFVIEELELIAHFDAISKSRTEFLERKENVQELRNAAKKYSSYGPCLGALSKQSPQQEEDDDDDVIGVDSALSSFLDDVALVSDIAEANNEDNNRMVVSLMTIHASKGTEYDCVFVVGLEEGTLPCNPALQEGAGSVQLEEEKRLCYVAMTRAKTRLILTWRKEVTSFSSWSADGPKTQEKQRSRFLNAIVSKKSKKNKTKSKATRTKNASPGTRSFSTQTQSAKRAGSSRTQLNRSGLMGGPNRSQPPRRREIPSPATISRAPPTRRTSNPSTRQQRKQQLESIESSTYKPDVEGIEALRSSLDSLSPSGAATVPPRRSSQPPKQPTAAAAAQQQRQPPKSKPNQSKPSPSSSSSSSDDIVDPMWFFPVGEKVVHMNFGKGTVVEPPPFRKIEDAKVRVQFDNGGKALEFPALGSEILPDTGNF